MRLFRNDVGVFEEVGAAAGITDTGSGKGLLTFDYDKDGDLDVFVVNTGGQPVLYRNNGGNDPDWLGIEADGTDGHQLTGPELVRPADEARRGFPSTALALSLDGREA